MTVLAKPVDVITREPVRVMQAGCPDEIASIRELWPRFEALVGLRGRRMYAAADVLAGTYTTCCPVRAGDDPDALGLEVGELPGGRFRRGRLVGDPPGVYERIGPGFEELEALGSVDGFRPLVEFYKRHDEIELWLPVTS